MCDRAQELPVLELVLTTDNPLLDACIKTDAQVHACQVLLYLPISLALCCHGELTLTKQHQPDTKKAISLVSLPGLFAPAKHRLQFPLTVAVQWLSGVVTLCPRSSRKRFCFSLVFRRKTANSLSHVTEQKAGMPRPCQLRVLRTSINVLLVVAVWRFVQ